MQKDRVIIQKTFHLPDKPMIYVLRGTRGDLLIDSGTKFTTMSLDRWIHKNHFNIRWLFLTHSHFDHSWNAKFLQKKYGTELIIHEREVPLYRGDVFIPVLPTSEKHRRFAELGNRVGKWPLYQKPLAEINHIVTDDDGDYLKQFGFDAKIIMLPGHTPGSMGILADDVLYCGDACSAVKGQYYRAFLGTDPEAIKESEKTIFALNPQIIAPGHGRLIEGLKTNDD